MIIVCPKCHKHFSDRMKYCPYCGTVLVIEETEEDLETKNLKKIQPFINQMEEYYRSIRNNCRYRFDDIKAKPFFGIEIYFSYSSFDYKGTIEDYLIHEFKKIQPWPYGSEFNYLYNPLDIYLTKPVSPEFKEKVESLIEELVSKFKALDESTANKNHTMWVDDLNLDLNSLKETYDEFVSEWNNSVHGNLNEYQKTYDFFEKFFQAYYKGGSGWVSEYVKIDIKEGIKNYINQMIMLSKDRFTNLKAYFDIKSEICELSESMTRNIKILQDKSGNLNLLAIKIPKRLIVERKY